MKLTARENEAFEILKAGGYFRYALETVYGGREQFQMRLRNAQHQVIKGFGYAAMRKFEKMGLLGITQFEQSSVWGQNTFIAPAVKFALILAGEI